MTPVAIVLLQLALILGLARAFGWLAARVGQPPVVGEILAGVLLGPSLIGPQLSGWLFPPDTVPQLKLLASVGLALFMYLVGLDLDLEGLRTRGRAAAAASTASVALPFALGVGLGWLLLEVGAVAAEGGWPFALFLGAAMAVTAFPVLARILDDRHLTTTELGCLALTTAAVDDVLAWTLLAGVTAAVGASVGGWTVLLAVPLVMVAMLAKPLVRRIAVSPAGVLGGLMVLAAAAEMVGLHLVFGAFLFGAVMPRSDLLREKTREWLDAPVTLLLPVFFLIAGLGVDLRSLDVSALPTLGAVMLVAVGGKFAGAYGGARSAGVPHAVARDLAVLVNTRGLTELVILLVGRELGLLSTELFTVMVVMALSTTAMTGPLLAWNSRRTAAAAVAPQEIGLPSR
jgi:Kef-type K+ transport system membrane component KefB